MKARPLPPTPDDEFYYGPGIKPGQKRDLKIAGAGAVVGVPGLLYARGLHAKGVPWKQMPGAAWGQLKGRKSFDIASTFRAGAIGAGKDIGSIGPRVWGHLKGIGKGLSGKALSSDARLVQLSSKLDQLILFQAPEPQAVQKPSVVVIRRTSIIRDRDEDKKGIGGGKLAALYGAGGITGAGIATGNAATRGFLTKMGKKIQRAAKQIRK